ncbi:hypothetical protein HPP92_012492 [Vanilla planifolia]|uniref:Uncharacterized protein n=1 Tax=Vanilla planifolia TaxID=51239 RepID=A0A835QNX8_VANPL|nr:hypothetical protein HPP92_012885 [Vanilla planifolia]KAG0477773.1 hypothetical protein HPP92_012492 [Vanilla planifolia]
MEKSMELDMGDQETVQDVKEIREDTQNSDIHFNLPQHVSLSTVFEREDEGEEDDGQSMEEEEVVVDVDEGRCSSRRNVHSEKLSFLSKHRPEDCDRLVCGLDEEKDTALARKTRIQNIFRLCGNHRELAQHVTIPTPPKRRRQDSNIHSPSPFSKEEHLLHANVSENHDPSLAASKELVEPKESKEPKADTLDVYVKWETSKELAGGLLGKFKVLRSSKLCDLRKLIETHLEEDNNNQTFSFLLLGDPFGSPVVKEKEAAVSVSKLPVYSNQLNGHLACLRPTRNSAQWQKQMPFRSVENNLQPHEMEV